MKIKSFDIFDTCLIRTCDNPCNIFDTLAWKILGENADINQVKDFTNIRKQGEKKANQLANGKDIDIYDIYANCDFSGLTKTCNEEIIKRELETESESLVSVDKIKKLIDNYRKQGFQIIFISDMYLPYDFIQKLLEREDLFKKNDFLFVSNHFNASKQSGELFKLVHDKLKIEYKYWEHFGDNPISDIKIPKQYGIKTNKIKNASSFYQELLKNNSSVYLDSIPSITSGISRSVILNSECDSRRLIAADIIAPLYVPFVYRILSKAKEKGISSLYFIARDGGILYEIAKLFSDLFPEIELHYIYLSRSSLYFPSIQKYDDIFSIIDINRTKGINPSVVIKNYTGVDISNLIHSNNENLIEILNNQQIKDFLWREHHRQRELILNYFLQEKLANNSSTKSAIVDLRGTRKSHQMINNILSNSGYNKVDGFYFEVVGDRVNPEEDENYDSLLHLERHQDSHQILNTGNAILESYFSAVNHGRTIGYEFQEGIIKPILEITDEISDNSKIFETNLKVLSQWTKYYKRNFLYLQNERVLEVGLSNYSNFLKYPSYQYLIPFSELKISTTGIEKQYLVKKLNFIEFIKGRSTTPLTWYLGSLNFTYGKNTNTMLKFRGLMIKFKNLIYGIIK